MEGMTNAQMNALLETIAKRLEDKTMLTPEEAARIVRESKTNVEEPAFNARKPVK